MRARSSVLGGVYVNPKAPPLRAYAKFEKARGKEPVFKVPQEHNQSHVLAGGKGVTLARRGLPWRARPALARLEVGLSWPGGGRSGGVYWLQCVALKSETECQRIPRRSTGYDHCCLLELPLSERPASRAASLMRFARSAPVKPVVLAAMLSTVTSAPRGRSTATLLSKRPGLSRAGSNTSALLVAAMQMTILSCFESKPSSSVSNWFSVCSLSSLPTPLNRVQMVKLTLGNCIDLVNEDNGWSLLPRLSK
ncbi:MAG: hypothetical protein FRX49_07340 [Trebouxia sp. A1-2]|nr:MAG: hypothetical protein FRX49_07340 [Trebouxia sp. A1-2]